MLSLAKDEPQLESDKVRLAQGVAVMLEHAKIDNLMNFLLCIEEHAIDLLSINSRNMSGTTALHVSAGNNSMQVLEYLITEVCVDINALDNWKRTALDEVGSRLGARLTNLFWGGFILLLSFFCRRIK